MASLAPIGGFISYSPNETPVIASMQRAIQEVFESFGFTPLVLRGVELLENLQAKGGINAQIYGIFEARSGTLTRLGIPFDHTVPLAIYVAQNWNQLVFPFKRNHVGMSWRAEQHAPGRFNEFVQADIDTIAEELTALDDAETISTLVTALARIGLPPHFKVLINHVDLAKSMLQGAGIQPEDCAEALRILDKLKPDNRPEVIRELCEKITNLTPETAEQVLATMEYSGPIDGLERARKIDEVAQKALLHLKEVETACEGMGVPHGTLELNTSLARGLNYYTGIVFETYITGREKMGSIASGGRFDRLVDTFRPDTNLKGVGGSIGLTRLFEVMKVEKMLAFPAQTTAQVFVGYRTIAERVQAIALATLLRNQGLKVELFTGDAKFRKQLAVCGKKGIPSAAMVMDADTGEVAVKSMRGGAHGDSSEDRQITCLGNAAAVNVLMGGEREPKDPETPLAPHSSHSDVEFEREPTAM